MTAPTAEPLLIDVADRIATITFNRPDRLNAFGAGMSEAFMAAFDRCDADDDIRAVIVTGAGKAFSAGADLSGGTFGGASMDAAPGAVRPVHRDGAGLLALKVYACRKPVIAAINGAAVGMGATVPLAMDVRIAAPEAHFGFVFARRGVVPEGCSTFFLPRLVGVSTAMEWCSGRRVPAEEAMARGMVRSIHPQGELMDAARAIAREFVDNAAPVSIAMTRQMMWRMLGASHPMEAHRVESLALHHRFVSADTREGVAAFLAKRAPDFPDRVSDMPDIWPDWEEPGFRK